MQRLLYVSESHISPSDAATAVSAIVKLAEIKNDQIGVTGALIFTGQHFAQVLEGSVDAISLLMDNICNDARHSNILIACKAPVTSRQFSNWSMAYYGSTPFVSRQITSLLEATSSSGLKLAAARLITLAYEFSKRQNPSQRLH